MACEDFQADLSASADGELSGNEGARLAAHLQTCPACAETLRAFQNTSALLRSLPVPHAPVSVTHPAMRQVRAMRGGPRTVRMLGERMPYASYGAAAAALAAAMTVAVFLGWHEFTHSPGAPANPAVTAGSSNSGSYRLSSAQDAVTSGSALASSAYDFRDPITHGRRDIITFDARERFAWEHGAWHHEQRFGRDGWWWEVGGAWYWYERPAGGPPSYVSQLRFTADSGPTGRNLQQGAATARPQP